MSFTTEFGEWLGQNVPGLTWSLTSVANIAVNEAPTGPDEAVTIVDTGGGEPDSALPFNEFHIQLIFRGTSSPAWPIDMWYTVYNYVHGKRNVVLPGGTLMIYCLVRQGNPVSIGTDDNDRHMYTMNLRGEFLLETDERQVP